MIIQQIKYKIHFTEKKKIFLKKLYLIKKDLQSKTINTKFHFYFRRFYFKVNLLYKTKYQK